jgi:hypothetical protein
VHGWEYLEVYVFDGSWTDSSGRKGRLKEVSVGSLARGFRDTTPLLNELGRQGWELIGTTGSSVTCYKLWLKRCQDQ